MKNLTRNGSSDNMEPSSPDPYGEMVLKQLISAIRKLATLVESGNEYFDIPMPTSVYSLPCSWAPDGWLPLDLEGRAYLRSLGIGATELRSAINEGVKARLLMRKVHDGVAYIKEIQKGASA